MPFGHCLSSLGHVAQCGHSNQSGRLEYAGAATLVHDDKLWVFGGMTSLENDESCNHMWAYDFFARQWSLIDQKGAIPAARTRACTALHDGKMLIYGYQEDDVRSGRHA